jgi:hypothetical protein
LRAGKRNEMREARREKYGVDRSDFVLLDHDKIRWDDII